MGQEWLREPVGAGSSHVYVRVGEQANITPEVRAALESLAAALQKEAGPTAHKEKECPNKVYCSPRDNCQPEVQQPCFWFTSCRIAPL